MKVAGFSFIRNAIKYDYPIVEAIESVLPICDAFYVAVGASDDDTRKLISEISSEKIHIIDTVWDDSLREGGRVLAEETNKAFDAIPNEFDWCFYIQGDEVFHEEGHRATLEAMASNLANNQVQGLVFPYLHFYGSYDYIGDSRRWYRREVRVIRNNKNIRSYKDAQGFRLSNKPLKVKLVDANVHHYGWVKHPSFQQEKQKSFHKMWHSDDWVEEHVSEADEYDYQNIDKLKKFEGSHPKVMTERLKRMNWKFIFDTSKSKKMKLKRRLAFWVEKHTGWRIGEYKNYKIV